MKIKALYIFFTIATFITTGCEVSEPSRHERHILKTYVFDVLKNERTFLVDGESPHPIPTTNKILYKNNDKLYTISLNGTGMKFISIAPGAASTFAFNGRVSPDGRKFAFVGNEKQYVRSDIFVVDTDGVGYKNLTRSMQKAEYLADFDPASEKILFQETIYDESGSSISACVSTMDIEGNNYQTILNEGGGVYLQYTPDGRRVIFFRYDTRSPGTDLYILHIDSLELEKVRIGTEIPSPTPVITRDDKFFYVGDRTDVYRLDLSTFQKEKLYSGISGEYYSFSHDFSKVAYFFQGIHILNLIEGKDSLVSEKMDANVWHLEFAQDDQSIIYTTHEVETYYE